MYGTVQWLTCKSHAKLPSQLSKFISNWYLKHEAHFIKTVSLPRLHLPQDFCMWLSILNLSLSTNCVNPNLNVDTKLQSQMDYALSIAVGTASNTYVYCYFHAELERLSSAREFYLAADKPPNHLLLDVMFVFNHIVYSLGYTGWRIFIVTSAGDTLCFSGTA